MPEWTVPDCTAAVNFYTSAFGAVEVRRQHSTHGHMTACRLRVGAHEVALRSVPVPAEHGAGDAAPSTAAAPEVPEYRRPWLRLPCARPGAVVDQVIAAGGTVEILPAGLSDALASAVPAQRRAPAAIVATDPYGRRWLLEPAR